MSSQRTQESSDPWHDEGRKAALRFSGAWPAELTAEALADANLVELNFPGKGLKDLPSDIGRISGLQRLNLAGNHLSALPAEFARLRDLRVLDLSDNRFESFPPEILELPALETLILSDNSLSEIPERLAALSNLHMLDLGRNPIRTLPQMIARRSRLGALSLDGADLEGIPEFVFTCTNLASLNLSNNRIARVPDEIQRLACLTELRLSNNGILELPATIAQLSRLHFLDLSHNRLTSIPKEVARLGQLGYFDLSYNELADLPFELGNLIGPYLVLNLDNNPLKEPLPELVRRGSAALSSYLTSLIDAEPQYEAKIMLVGEGNVGKTSLLASLMGAPFVANRDTTHGIEIRRLSFGHPDVDVEIEVRVWDFGGQEVYRVTHQFFFSQRALYIVVWNAREGQEQNEVEGWLRRIRLRVGGSVRAIVVATHCDERRPELDYPYLDKAMPGFLAGEFAVDNSSGNGVELLRNAIIAEASRLPQMGQRLSRRWIAARAEVLSRADLEPQISYEKFAEICERHGLIGEEIVTFAELLHDLGQIVYYGDDEGLRDVVVLNPEWLTKAIGFVLEDNDTRLNHGVLDHARLKAIWYDRADGVSYPVQYHRYFLRLMEKFDVSYRLESGDRSLVAQLVPHETPELPWTADVPVAYGLRGLSLLCKLSEVAPGLIAWLTVRHHRASIGKHWRTGVFLRHPEVVYQSEALLELQSDELYVHVRAPSPDYFFNVIRYSIEELLERRWPGLTYTMFVPCPTRAGNSVCSGRFRLDGLLRYREKGGQQQNCLDCGAVHTVSELLTGFRVPDPVSELGRIASQLNSIVLSTRRTESLASRTVEIVTGSAESIRQLSRALSAEVIDCPRLFTLTRTKMGRLLKVWPFTSDRFELTLWCEHPSYWHPWNAATYGVKRPKGWIRKVAPYAKLIVRVLKIATPITVAVAGVTFTDDEISRATRRLDLMKVLVEKLPEVGHSDSFVDDKDEGQGGLAPAEGAALRAFRILLFEQDAARSFGGLRRVQVPSGDYAWVCQHHYPEYDPGLPDLP